LFKSSKGGLIVVPLRKLGEIEYILNLGGRPLGETIKKYPFPNVSVKIRFFVTC